MINLEMSKRVDDIQMLSIAMRHKRGEKLLPEEEKFLKNRKEIFILNQVVVVRGVALLRQKCESVNISFGYNDFFKKPFTKEQDEFLDASKIHKYLIIKEVGIFDVVVRSLMSPEGGFDMDFTISKIDLENII